MSPLAKIQSAIEKPFMPAVFFLSGVTYDTATLTRIDRLQDNLVLMLYLALLGTLIVLTGRLGIEPPPDREQLASLPPFIRWVLESRPYYPMASQFLLGGLFSAYTIFYSRSTSFTGTAVFFSLLIALLVTNEFLRDRLSNLRLLVGLYGVVTFAFFTFFLPVMTGYMNAVVFLVGAGVSVAVTLRVVQLIYRNNPERSRQEVIRVTVPTVACIVLLAGFYFMNWIPPVPLSLKFGGMYHEIKRTGDQFELSFDRSGNVQIRLIPRTSRSIASPPSLRRSISTPQFTTIGISAPTARDRSCMRIEFPSRSRVGARAAIEPIVLSSVLIQEIGEWMSKPKMVASSDEFR